MEFVSLFENYRSFTTSFNESAMDPLELERDFRQSCELYKLFPMNQPRSVTFTYPDTLKAFREQLDRQASALFVTEESKYEVTIRELGPVTFGE
jgi:hypothetical protein